MAISESILLLWVKREIKRNQEAKCWKCDLGVRDVPCTCAIQNLIRNIQANAMAAYESGEISFDELCRVTFPQPYDDDEEGHAPGP